MKVMYFGEMSPSSQQKERRKSDYFLLYYNVLGLGFIYLLILHYCQQSALRYVLLGKC